MSTDYSYHGYQSIDMVVIYMCDFQCIFRLIPVHRFR